MSNQKCSVDPRYLDMTAEVFKQGKQRTYTWMHLREGATVLEVGCGPGIDMIALANLVGPMGQVVGVDHDATMLVEAEKRTEQAGCKNWCRYYQTDAMTLPFEADTFDAVRCERVLMHVPNPQAIISEMVRVTRPGGWVVVMEPDWNTFSINTPEFELEQRLTRYRLEQTLHNGQIGRQLFGFFKQQSLFDVTIELHPFYVTDYSLMRYGSLLDQVEAGALAAGMITEEELNRWRQSLERIQAEGASYCHSMLVLAAGQKGETASLPI